MAKLQLSPSGRLELGDCDDGQPPCDTFTAPQRLDSVSVTQCNDYVRCPRRWFFKRIRRVEVPERKGVGKSLGSELHGHIERYLKTGQLPPEDYEHYRKVKAAVRHLPEPGPGLMVEKYFTIEGDFRFTGKIDLVNLRHTGKVQIFDHKTTSKVNELAKEPVDVTADPQMLTYAEWAFRIWPDHDVEVTHNTISTTHVAKVLPLDFRKIAREQASQNWGRQLEQIRSMIALAQNPPADWNDVQSNPEACNDYGGCDFLPICALKTPNIGVTMSAEDSKGEDSLLERLAKLTAPTSGSLVGIPLSGAQVGKVELLPPDAPSRLTPQPQEKEKRPAKKKSTPIYEVDGISFSGTPQSFEAYLQSRADDGWELVTVVNAMAVWRR